MKLSINSIKDAFEKYRMSQAVSSQVSNQLVHYAIPYLLGYIDMLTTFSDDKWQPIETFHWPNDTEWILVWGHEQDKPGDFNMHEVKWYPQEKIFWGYGDKVIIPTHWQPLLEGPKS